jgi:hypothetical protein
VSARLLALARRAPLLAVLLGAGAAGCGGLGPSMSPGQDCLACHSNGQAQTWTLAGTLYRRPDAGEGDGLEGAHVLLTDAIGRSYTLTTNAAGNFYTAEALEFPVQVSVQKDGVEVWMSTAAVVGGCNGCHTSPPTNSAPGRLYLPVP